MNLIAISSILIAENRQRRHFDLAKIHELSESIQSIGLLSPIVLREDAGTFTLVAGERRLRAIKNIYDLMGSFRFDGEPIPPGLVPYITLGTLDPLEREIAELEENIRRENITWQEEAMATFRITEIRTSQAIAKGEKPPTTLEIALEVKNPAIQPVYAQQVVRRENIVAKHLERPEIAKAKSLKDAMKILLLEEQAEKHRMLAETVGVTFSTASHRLYRDDAVSWLEKCPDEQFDVIITDPPYGMNANDFRDGGGTATAGHIYSDDENTFLRCICALRTHLRRVARPAAHLYLFCDISKYAFLCDEMTAGGWKVHRTPFIWHKPNGNRIPWPFNGPQRKWEMLLYAIKGDRPCVQGASDVITCPSDENLGNSAQKPVAIYTELLRRSVKPGDRVLDCFGGTGPILEAAHAVKCIATYVEKDSTSYGIALARLSRMKAQLETGEQ